MRKLNTVFKIIDFEIWAENLNEYTYEAHSDYIHYMRKHSKARAKQKALKKLASWETN